MIFTEAERAYLDQQPLGRLATRRPDGSLQNNPVGFSVGSTAETIEITGYDLAASRKFGNIADNGQVAFVVDDLASRQPWTVRGVEVRGTATALTHPQEHIVISPRRVISWGLGEWTGMRGRDIAPASTNVPGPPS